MRPVLSIALVLGALVAGCLEPTPTQVPEGVTDPKADALAFSLRIVETFLEGDYETFRGMLAEPLYTLEGEGPFTREHVDGSMGKQPFPDGRDYSAYTVADYHATYAPYVLTFDEVRERYPEVKETTWDGWTPDGDDYVFVGSEVKEGQESFMWDDLLAFAVTLESGEWRFKAFSG